jgi:hypothetical protein
MGAERHSYVATYFPQWGYTHWKLPEVDSGQPEASSGVEQG